MKITKDNIKKNKFLIKYQVANKDYICQLTGKKIKKGDRYCRQVKKQNGKLSYYIFSCPKPTFFNRLKLYFSKV